MTLLFRPVAILCLASFLASNSSGAGSDFQPKSDTSLNEAGAAENSANSATPATTNVSVTLDVLTNRHAISQYVYGGAYPQDAPTITDSGLTAVRWGGDSTSTYNWQLFTNNAANDYYYEDFDYTEIGDGDSTKYISDVKAAGSHPLMTMPMLPMGGKECGGLGQRALEFFGCQVWSAVQRGSLQPGCRRRR